MRVAIPVPTEANHQYNRRCWPSYAEAVRATGAEPVEVPLNSTASELRLLAESCQAILLPGSPADVLPSRFGQPTGEFTSPADHAREETDLFLLDHAFSQQKPLLGVCFGCQILNVFRGGTLVQHLNPVPVNHPSAQGVAVAHTIAIEQGSLLASICVPEEAPLKDAFLQLPVNSSHHQAVGIAGQGLKVTARSVEDGVVEALEGTLNQNHFVLGVQWHPERTTEVSSTSRAIFTRLQAEAKHWQEAH